MKRKFQLGELKWGAIKKYEGIEGKNVGLTFDSYVVFYKDDNGMCVNAIDEEECYKSLESLRPFKTSEMKCVKEGTSFVETISDRADIILCRIFDVTKKQTFSVKDIEDAILESDTFYFKDAEEIREKRQRAIVKTKIKSYKN